MTCAECKHLTLSFQFTVEVARVAKTDCPTVRILTPVFDYIVLPTSLRYAPITTATKLATLQHYGQVHGHSQ